MTLYDLAYLALAPIAAPALAYKALTRGKYRQSGPAMLGRGSQWVNPQSYPEGTVWLHAVSAGEVTAAKAVAPELVHAFPQWPLVASTTTETGQAAARKTLVEARETFYFPFDFSWNVQKFLRRFNPRLVALMEAELWPNFLQQATSGGARVFLLNGRMSERSHRRHLRARRLLAGPLGRISAFCMESEGDAERIGEILGSRERVFVTGNCKFDAEFPTLTEDQRLEWLARFGLDPARPVVVFGSSHPGEEDVALQAFAEAKAIHPTLALVLAPRHPERFAAVAETLHARGIAFRRAKSSHEGAATPDVVLLDTMGELAKAYGLGSLAVVGGSFAPIGGHNLLEAAAHSVPVLHGPHMHRQPDMARLLTNKGGALQIQAEVLGKTIADLLSDPPRRIELGRAARRALDQSRGSARRMVEIVEGFFREDRA